MEEADLPRGLWNCHSCRVKKVPESSIDRKPKYFALSCLFQTQEAAYTLTHSIEVDDGADSDSSKNGKRLNNSTSSSTIQLLSSGQGVPEKIAGRRRTNNSDDVDVETPGVGSEKSSDREEIFESAGKVSFFAPLIKVAASMNPQQFELPPELVEPIPFPGKFKQYNL